MSSGRSQDPVSTTGVLSCVFPSLVQPPYGKQMVTRLWWEGYTFLISKNSPGTCGFFPDQTPTSLTLLVDDRAPPHSSTQKAQLQSRIRCLSARSLAPCPSSPLGQSHARSSKTLCSLEAELQVIYLAGHQQELETTNTQDNVARSMEHTLALLPT